MYAFLENIGLLPYERIMILIAHILWSSIDWETPLWKSAQYDVWTRFESRVRSAAREQTLHGFVSRLARKCHIAVPRFDQDLLIAIGRAEPDADKSLAFARKESGMLVGVLRAWHDEIKRANTGARK